MKRYELISKDRLFLKDNKKNEIKEVCFGGLDIINLLNEQDTKWQKLEKWLDDKMEHYNDCLNENVLILSERQEVLSARYNQCFETIAQMEYIEKELGGGRR